MLARTMRRAVLAGALVLSVGPGSLLASAHAATPAATATTTPVSGVIQYTDTASKTHPSQTVTVQIMDANTADGTVLATTTTDATGHYAATAPTFRADGTTPTQLFVRAVAANTTGFSIHPDGSATAYHLDSTPAAATGTATAVNITANNTDVAATAFDAADALVSADAYTLRINGGALFPALSVNYPAAAGVTTHYEPGTNPPVIALERNDNSDWDVVFHEYGHFVADKFGFLAAVGGSHNFGQNDGEPPAAKQTGIQLAWNEGFATYFAISAEQVLGVSALNIPNAGDLFFDDVEPASSSHVDIGGNSGTTAVGEDDELSVARALWHFHSDAKLGLSDTAIISTFKTATPLTLSDGVKALLKTAGAAPFDDSAPFDPTAERLSIDYGCALVDQSVAPKLTAPADGTLAKADSPPAFTWNQDGAGPSNRLNQFTVQFWSTNFDALLFESPQQAAATYTPTTDDWKNKILAAKDKNGKYPTELRIVVKGTGTNAPATGPYKSCSISLDVQRVDVVFAIDTTGSMSPYIASVVASASAVVDQLSTDGIDYRIGVVDYKDVDSDPSVAPGCPPDPYAAQTDLNFSNVKADVQNALGALPAIVGGGCDIPEDVYSGVEQAIGLPWRTGVKKAIIQLGDAPGHDPEAHSGFTLAQVQADAAKVDPAEVFPILIGSDPSAHVFDQALADATGGLTIDATANPSQAGPAIVTAIQDIAALPTADAGGPYAGTVGAPVTLDASGSFSANGAIAKYEWDFTGSGTFTTASGPATTFTYTAPYTGNVTVRVTDSAGKTALATAKITVTPGAARVVLDQLVNATEQTGKSPIVSPAVTTANGNELLLAFISADGAGGQRQAVTGVSGGGLTWTLAARANSVVSTGTAEVWQAYATAPLSAVRVTATLQHAKWDGAITVATFTGAAPTVGATATDGALTGAATVGLKTTVDGSLVFAAGHDWLTATAPTPLAGQAVVTQNLDLRVNDAYWVQRTTGTAAAGTTQVIGDTMPTGDRWEFAAVEVKPAP